MNWTTVLIFAAVIAVFLLFKRAGQVSAKTARAYLSQGALVIDVRSPGEYNAGHLSRAINMPLGEIETLVPRRVKDKSQVLLLHCQSGMRSGVARNKLKSLGYTRAFNLGSYQRAANIVGRG